MVGQTVRSDRNGVRDMRNKFVDGLNDMFKGRSIGRPFWRTLRDGCNGVRRSSLFHGCARFVVEFYIRCRVNRATTSIRFSRLVS